MALATEPRPASLPLPGGRPHATVRVHPILTGEVRAPRAHTDRPVGRLAGLKIGGQLLGPRRGWDWLPVPAFLIEHPGAGAVLVDTGFHPSVATSPVGNLGRLGATIYQIRMDHDQALRFQLPDRGVQPRDVSVVIMTHLHFDHASGISEFPGATFLLDRREWDAAAAQGVTKGYHHRHFDHAFDWRALNYRSDQVESFASFAQSLDVFGDGSVRLVSTPGHTLGHQSLVLRLSNDNELLLVGDAAFTTKTLSGPARPLLIADTHLFERSLREIRRYIEQTPEAVVIPGHDGAAWAKLKPVYE